MLGLSPVSTILLAFTVKFPALPKPLVPETTTDPPTTFRLSAFIVIFPASPTAFSDTSLAIKFGLLPPNSRLSKTSISMSPTLLPVEPFNPHFSQIVRQ